MIEGLEENPEQGTALTNNCHKIRIAIKSKGKGKRAGARVIILIQVTENKVFLLTIYDKSEQTDIKDKELKYLLSFID